MTAEEHPDIPPQATSSPEATEDGDEDYWTRRARESYETTTARLRHKTSAAWIRWEDLDPDARAIWIEAVRKSDPGPPPSGHPTRLW